MPASVGTLAHSQAIQPFCIRPHMVMLMIPIPHLQPHGQTVTKQQSSIVACRHDGAFQFQSTAPEHFRTKEQANIRTEKYRPKSTMPASMFHLMIAVVNY